MTSNNKEIFDFSKVPVQSDVKYLRPGQYILGISKLEFVKVTGNKPDGTPKSSYLDITFSGVAGETTQKFYISTKAFERIQTLHMSWFGELCSKVFDSTEAVGAYFEKLFNHNKAKQVKRRMVVGGRQDANGKVWAEMPYSRFILADNIDFEEKEYEPGSPEYVFHVKVQAPNPSTNTDSVLIGNDLPGAPKAKESWDDLPF